VDLRMAGSGFAAPVIVRPDGSTLVLKQVSLSAKGEHAYNEAWLQRLLFAHPETLPIAEIDDSFSGLIPL
jgi:hypothetical protein